MARVQIFSPHPDDAEIFLGGTLLKHYHGGDQLQLVMVTRGELGTRLPWLRGERMRALRTAETDRRMARLPDAELVWLDLPDGQLEGSAEAAALIRRQLEAWAPEIVYLPEHPRSRSIYRHPDHMATGELVERAVAESGRDLLLRYYHSRRYNRLLFVAPYERENQDAIRCFVSQYRLSCDPAFLLRRRELLRALLLRRWGIKNRWSIHEAINRFVAVAHLPVAPGTEAFRELGSKSL